MKSLKKKWKIKIISKNEEIEPQTTKNKTEDLNEIFEEPKDKKKKKRKLKKKKKRSN